MDIVSWAVEDEFEPTGQAVTDAGFAARQASDRLRTIGEDPIITVTMPDGSIHEIDLQMEENSCLTHGAECPNG